MVEPKEKILAIKLDTELSKKNILIVSLSGILNTFSSIELVKLLTPDILSEFTSIIFDFENLKFIDSMGMSAIITIFKRVHLNQGKMVAIKAKSGIKTVFEITNIIQKIPIVDSLEKAIIFLEEENDKSN